MNHKIIFSIVFGAIVPLESGFGSELLWDNGDFVTHPGEGFGGLDVSLNSAGEFNFAGQNVRLLDDANAWFRISDDFTVMEFSNLTSIITYGYEPFELPPTWEQANLNIWRMPPWGAVPDLVVSMIQSPIQMEFSQVYRVFNEESLDSTDRPIFAVHWDIAELRSVGSGPLVLEPGTYWIDWQVVGGTTGWAPPVMEANKELPSSPTTIFDNGFHLRPIGWVPTRDLGMEIPFEIYGNTDLIFSDEFE